MVCEMEGGPGKEKDIIGSSAQGFGTDLVASLLGRTGLGKCCWPSWTNQTWECCRPSWTNRTWEYCWTPDLKCCSFPCSS
ncbi:hypothetical protein RCL_jg29163.t1 [Rhizophagus clarus]|uniref:Uncharacterized protein n=1 Tax=Rhizophagus clarus TaxID=94130 RepID=A0A8H3M208_9GLOM|nr:hypothetical protein RCL_jg29163.t1 [Rhizophagus clarus]